MNNHLIILAIALVFSAVASSAEERQVNLIYICLVIIYQIFVVLLSLIDYYLYILQCCEGLHCVFGRAQPREEF